jgi:hypothetical protein
MSDEAIEKEIQAKGKTAPRVTPAALQAVITSEFYFTAAEGVMSASGHQTCSVRAGEALNLLTFCVLVLKNGFTVTGESACASPENFDAEIGQQIARQNAEQKIWPLEGYLLKQCLFEGQNAAPKPQSGLPPHQQRVMDEHTELSDKCIKLFRFFDTPIFEGLAEDEKVRLHDQYDAMMAYAGILIARMNAF